MCRCLLVLVLLGIVALVVNTASASAAMVSQVGDVEICFDVVGTTTHGQNLTNNVEGAQTFTTSNGFTLTAVKIPVTRIGNVDTLTVEIWPVDGSNRPNQPGGVLGSESVTFTSPTSTGTATDQNLECNTTDNSGQVIQFDPVVSLSSATTYAIVAWSTSTVDLEWNYQFNDPPVAGGQSYSGGIFWNNESAFSRNDPATWQQGSGDRDSGFALFGNIVTPTDVCDYGIDCWIGSWLDIFGWNNVEGRLLFSVVLAGGLLVVMVVSGIKPLIAMMVSGLLAFGFGLGALLPPAVLVTLLALASIGMFVGFIILRRASGGDDF